MTEKSHNGVEILRQAVKDLPAKPGVYRMLDTAGEPLYIGKAKHLKKRVTSYTHLNKLTTRIQRMVMQTAALDITTTETEAEALLLESNLIKHHHPRYNIDLKDNKSFPYIMIEEGHGFPRISKHRGEKKKGASLFGPYASAGDVNRAITALQKSFLLRPCADTVFSGRTRPCLEYQIKRCSAPCVNKISARDYGDLVTQAKTFLSGKNREVQEVLHAQMEAASAAMEYEQAARLRDRIRALTHIQSKQYINASTLTDADVIGLHTEAGQCCVQVFFFRGGQALGNKAYFPTHTEDHSNAEIIEAFLSRFYHTNPPPPLILLSHKPVSNAVLEQAFSSLAEHKVTITVPQKGEKHELVIRALTNAIQALERKRKEDANERELLEATAKIFDLEETPRRIEVYDNSHISGRHAVGAMIVAGPEGFIKNAYRRFTIKDLPKQTTGGDDYAMLREVLTRRFKRLKKEQGETQEHIPDLVLIDGGAGHLTTAAEVFADLGISDIPFVCISKGPDRNAGREQFHMPGKKPFTLPKEDPALYYLQRLRDEAHRFAIMSHRKKRSAAITTSRLDDIEGVGGKRKQALLKYFGSASAVERASTEELAKVEGISKKMAKTIYDHLHMS